MVIDISDDVLLSVLDCFVSELTLSITLQFVRAKSLGYFEELECDDENEEHRIIEKEGFDIFGQPKEVKVVDIDCPECHRFVAATRFAPHLEKCMGMGRISSRVARRRIANVNPSDDLVFGDDDDLDAAWTTKAKRPKIKRHGSPKLSKKLLGKVKSDLGTSPQGSFYLSETDGSDRSSFEALSPQSKEKFLKAMCGVVSEYTNRLCTRSLRCPQHTDEQRASARSLLLPFNSLLIEETGSEQTSDSSLSTDTTWAPGNKKKRGKSKAKKALVLPS